jgi:DNA polymerase III alpha subunit
LGIEESTASRHRRDCFRGPENAHPTPGFRGEQIRLGGVVAEVQVKSNKAGNLYALAKIEDLDRDLSKISLHGKSFQNSGALLEKDQVVIVTGRLESRDEQPRFTARDIQRTNFVVTGHETLRSSPRESFLEPRRHQGVEVRSGGERGSNGGHY